MHTWGNEMKYTILLLALTPAALAMHQQVDTLKCHSGNSIEQDVTGLDDISLSDDEDKNPNALPHGFKQEIIITQENAWRKFLRRHGWRPRNERHLKKEITRRRLPKDQPEDFSCCCCVRDTGITCCLLCCCFISLNCCCGKGGSFYFTCCESE